MCIVVFAFRLELCIFGLSLSWTVRPLQHMFHLNSMHSSHVCDILNACAVYSVRERARRFHRFVFAKQNDNVCTMRTTRQKRDNIVSAASAPTTPSPSKLRKLRTHFVLFVTLSRRRIVAFLLFKLFNWLFVVFYSLIRFFRLRRYMCSPQSSKTDN